MRILHINNGDKVLSEVPNTPPSLEWVYQIGFFLQLSSNEAGIFCNIRRGGVMPIDLEEGNDLIIFKTVSGINTERVVPLNRSSIMTNKVTNQEQLLSIYPIKGGFVPLGAKRKDGSAHPYEGTGFAMSTIYGYPLHLKDRGFKKGGPGKETLQLIDVQQYRYDGDSFSITRKEKVSQYDMISGWKIDSSSMSNAIPDGDDLIMGLCGITLEGEKRSTGIARWKYKNDKWELSKYAPIAKDGSYEPSGWAIHLWLTYGTPDPL